MAQLYFMIILGGGNNTILSECPNQHTVLFFLSRMCTDTICSISLSSHVADRAPASPQPTAWVALITPHTQTHASGPELHHVTKGQEQVTLRHILSWESGTTERFNELVRINNWAFPTVGFHTCSSSSELLLLLSCHKISCKGPIHVSYSSLGLSMKILWTLRQ